MHQSPMKKKKKKKRKRRNNTLLRPKKQTGLAFLAKSTYFLPIVEIQGRCKILVVFSGHMARLR
jgi:hypothetical protein